MRPWTWAAAAGVAIGLCYSLSPLTVVFLALLLPSWKWASAGLNESERRWMLALLCIAVGLRLVVIGGLFVTADPDIPYANFFGDEEFFKRKTTWLRNVQLGIPISTADFLYAFDVTGDSGYVTLLTFVQALFGLSPYGIHVMNMVCYIAATLILFRIAWRAYGGPVAITGCAILLFLPSLFLWSISALKESPYFLVAATSVHLAILAARAQPRWHRIVAGALIVPAAFALQSLREGGLALMLAGVFGGLIVAAIIQRPRLVIASLVVLPIVATLALRQPAIQERAIGALRQAAFKHWGHVNTPGQTYKLMEPWFYRGRNYPQEMEGPAAVGYVARALKSYIIVPAPWEVESRATLAFMPEQMIWYALVILAPIGLAAGLRRDPLVTSVFTAYASAAAILVALSGGNVGTLVRHRGLALPYLVWLSACGAFEVAHRLAARRPIPAPFERPA